MKTNFECGYKFTRVKSEDWGETVIGTGKLTDLFYFLSKNEGIEPEDASSRDSGDSWAGASWEEAINSPLVGYPEIINRLNEKVDFHGLKVQSKRKVKSKVLDTSGAWIMPLVMQGSVPLAAVGSRKIENRAQKTITLYYSEGASGAHSSETLIEAGINMAKCCWSLEQQGYKVRLVSGFYAGKGHARKSMGYMLSYEVKGYNETFNPINLSVACHVATFRRLGFRTYELISGDESIDRFDDGYGYPINSSIEQKERVKTVFPDAVVISSLEAAHGVEYIKECIKERAR